MEETKTDYPFISKKKLKPNYERIIKNPELGKNLRKITLIYLNEGEDKLKSMYLNGKQSGLTALQLRNSMVKRFVNLAKKNGMTDYYRDIIYLLCYDPSNIGKI